MTLTILSWSVEIPRKAQILVIKVVSPSLSRKSDIVILMLAVTWM